MSELIFCVSGSPGAIKYANATITASTSARSTYFEVDFFIVLRADKKNGTPGL
jgi:hypothetical protein